MQLTLGHVFFSIILIYKGYFGKAGSSEWVVFYKSGVCCPGCGEETVTRQQPIFNLERGEKFSFTGHCNTYVCRNENCEMYGRPGVKIEITGNEEEPQILWPTADTPAMYDFRDYRVVVVA